MTRPRARRPDLYDLVTPLTDGLLTATLAIVVILLLLAWSARLAPR